jgi:hypothetical protein
MKKPVRNHLCYDLDFVKNTQLQRKIKANFSSASWYKLEAYFMTKKWQECCSVIVSAIYILSANIYTNDKFCAFYWQTVYGVCIHFAPTEDVTLD